MDFLSQYNLTGPVFGLATFLIIGLFHLLRPALLPVWGASSFRSVGELSEQRKRVGKGWFPRNPNRR